VAIAADGPRAPDYPDHTRLLVVRDGDGRESPVVTPADWQVRRAHILAHLQEVMGPLPGGERSVPLAVEVVATIDEPGYVRKKITYAAEPGDRVPAWLLVPKGLKGKAPAVLCLHQTVKVGKDEPVGLGTNPDLAYARELAARGYVAIAPDYPNFGEYRVDPYALGYASASMKGVWNHMRAVDVLTTLAEVDPGRIGAIGHSLGGHNAVFVALFDDRIGAVVSSCGFNAFPHYYGGNIAGWSHSGYMPRLRSVYGLDPAKVPFDFPELIGALAPRTVFVNAPTRDANFEIGGVKACLEAAGPVFRLLGQPGHLRAVHPEAGHSFPRGARDAAFRLLDETLKP
jgi:dienelactone hydrolase